MQIPHLLGIVLLSGTVLAAPRASKSVAIHQRPLIRPAYQESDEFDLEPSAQYAFSGITTFAQLPAVQCLAEDGPVDEILIVGFPFDTATSYRTGTRFGPNAIRQGSRAVSLA